MSKVFIFFMVMLPFSCLAQFAISGRVINQADTKPVTGASVFLNNTSAGAHTSADGTFTLPGLAAGKYKLVISVVGFDTYNQEVVISNASVNLNDVTIYPKTISLKEVKITPKDDPDRITYLSNFKEQFLGVSEFAKECTILNPQIIDFDYNEDSATLTASSGDFLEIENNALGYRIKYLLSSFSYTNKDITDQKIQYKGYALFGTLNGTPAQQRYWEKNRQEVYANSEMHFFRSVLDNRIDEEGFKVLRITNKKNPERPADDLITAELRFFEAEKSKPGSRDSLAYWTKKQKLPVSFQKLMPQPLKAADLLSPVGQLGLYKFGGKGDCFYVTYNKNHHFLDPPRVSSRLSDPSNTDNTLIAFNAPSALVDAYGRVVDPFDLSYAGVWVRSRMAELLPADYAAPQAKSPQMDSTVSKKVIASLLKYNESHPGEKVYLHFDKPYYAAGDTIYFKAYLTTRDTHELSQLSGVLHVDFIDNENKIEQSIHLEVSDGLAWGDFAIPATASTGTYRIRAYTRLMRNDGENDFFDQNIAVSAVLNNKVPENAVAVAQPVNEVQFFPEGGTLVAGLQSKVAFKAIDANGMGINIKGTVVDNDNQEVCSFASAHLGMGSFSFKPTAGKSYKAKISFPNGKQDIISLPAAVVSGLTLSVNNDSTLRALVTITADEQYFKENRDKTYTLELYSGGKVTTMLSKLDNAVATTIIAKNELSSGIATVTLFSPQGEPLAERLFFIENHDELKLGISSEKITYTQREKVNIKLNGANSDALPVAGHFSVSVIDESRVPVDDAAESTLVNYLLLTSDLKGFVEQPNYYFTDAGAETARHLDLLMLTQGYRKFEWKQVLNNSGRSLTYQPEDMLEVTGALKTPTGKPVSNGNISLFDPGQKLYVDTLSDGNGNFKFKGLYLTDSAKLVLRARKQNNGANVLIQVDEPDIPTALAVSNKKADAEISPEITALMQNLYSQKKPLRTSGIMLKQVNIKGAVEDKQLASSQNVNGAGHADRVILADKWENYPNLLDLMQTVVPGVYFENGVMYSFHTTVELMTGRRPAMVLIIDGVTVSTDPGADTAPGAKASPTTSMDLINPADIYSIEVLESSKYLNLYGTKASGGALVITTKHGSGHADNANYAPAGILVYKAKGFYKAREFYSPKYIVPQNTSSPKDLRTTIFWKPELVTDKDGNTSFDFYNGDSPGSYRVVIEGMDEHGNLGRSVYRYTVN